jgi:hypothetical protein
VSRTSSKSERLLRAIRLRHCEERQRRSNPESVALDCFASLAMTMAAAFGFNLSNSKEDMSPHSRGARRAPGLL